MKGVFEKNMKQGLRKLIGTKEFYKKLLVVAVPIMIQNGISNFVSMLDNIMVGRIGTDQMSGVAIANQLLFVFYMCIFGSLAGAGIFGAQFYGKKDYEGVRHTFCAKLLIGLAVLLLSLAMFWFGGSFLISQYLHEGSEVGNLEATFAYAKSYLNIMLIGLVPFVIAQVYASTLRECGKTIAPMVASIIAVFLNLGLNFILIFGMFGCPRLMADGAAIATCISRVAECLILVIWTHATPKRHEFIEGAYRHFKIPVTLAKQIIWKGMPLLLNELLWSSGMATINQCYAYRGLAIVGAVNITSTLSNVFNIVFIAMGSSVAIIVGQLLGAGKIEEAKDTDTKLIAFSVVSSAIVAGIMACFAGVFPKSYQTEPIVRELATKFILINALIMPANAFTNASYFTIRSGGKTGITFVFDSGFTWIVLIPIALMLSRLTNLPIVWLYLTVQSCDIIKCIIGYIMVKKGNWVQNIVTE